ncbi:hypothetical protein [Planktomarina sp.]|jgi:hypothetical protein|uniref:hypothetical protein n=1 Tax=Planktomarina sp. TaxID=2024851 RepID=UPI00326155F0
MAINVNEVYKTALLILNKEQRGYVTPNEFNKIATQVQLQMFENYAEELNQQLRVPQADSDYSDRIMNTDEKLSIFKSFGDATYDNVVTPTTPYYTLPSDLYRLGTVVYTGLNNSEVELQRLQRHDFYNIQKSLLTASTKYFPTYLYENERIYVKPDSINSGVSVNYLRKPKDPRWGYSVGTLGQYIYDPTVYGEALLNTGTNTLTSSITTGLTVGTIGTYTPSYTGGSGTGLVISANVTTPTNVTLSVTTAGTGYVVGEVIEITAGQLGGGSTAVQITLQASDFNNSSTYGSTDIELHVSERVDFIIKLLFYFGVVIRDPQIIQVAMQEARAEEINEKS